MASPNNPREVVREGIAREVSRRVSRISAFVLTINLNGWSARGGGEREREQGKKAKTPYATRRYFRQ